MGKRVRQRWDLPPEQTGAVLALGLAFLAGGLLGLLFVGLADGAGAQELAAYLRDYMELSRAGKTGGVFWQTLWERWGELVPVLLLGLTPLGLVGIPALLGVRGFCLAFSAACFCRVFGGAGLLPAFVLYGIPALIWCPVLFLAGSRSFCRAGQADRSAQSSQTCRISACVFLMLLFLCAVLENTAVPVLFWGTVELVL